MGIQESIELICLGVVTLGLIISIIIAIVKGKLKEYIIETMEEAEKMGKSGSQKLCYVLEKVKNKYKIATVVLNIRKFVEKIIDITKQINYKKGE